jgi:hypothetical protein
LFHLFCWNRVSLCNPDLPGTHGPPFHLPHAEITGAHYHSELVSFGKPRLCTWETVCDVCLSQSGLFHLTWWPLVSFIFLQTT